MRKLLLSTVAFAALSGVAFAADLPSTKGAPVYEAPPAFTWTGFYVGVNVGLAGDDYDYTGSAFGIAAGGAHLTSSGVIGGGQIGYNYQFAGPYVLGIEADIQAASVTGEVNVNGVVGGTAFAAKVGSRLDDLGTVRARLGYAILDNRGLLYATGGLAYGGVNSYLNASATGVGAFGVSKNTTGTGWTVGGGFEYALTNNWSFRAEYLYVDLGKESLYNGPLFGTGVNLGVEPRDNIVRVGLNYKFGGPEPVMAKY